MEKHKSAFNTVIVLTVTMLMVKILSAVYRVPYQNILGDAGLYAYQQVYPMAAIVSVLSLNAIPSVISQVKHPGFSFQILRVLQLISLITLIVLFVLSGQLSIWMGDPELKPMLRASLLVLIPFSFVAVMRGELQSKHQMNQIAVSQMVDQVLRVGTIMIAIIWFTKGATIYQSGWLSILGSTIGLSGAYIYLKYAGPKLKKAAYDLSRKQLSDFVILTLFYALSYLIMILWQLIDSFTLLNGLKATGMTLEQARIDKGIYDRGASLIQMGLIVTTSFSLVLIPLLATAKAKRDQGAMNDYAKSALKITIVFSSAAAFGLFNLIRPFNLFLFKSTDEYHTLGIYMFAVIFVSLIIMYTAMLQITESYKVQWVGLMSGLMFKVGLNILLIPHLQIMGAAIATVTGLASYALILHVAAGKRYQLEFRGFIIGWLITLGVMSIVLQLIMLIPYDSRLGALCVSLIGVTAGIIIVGIAMLRFKIITAAEWAYLPFGDKVIMLMKDR